MEERDLVRGKNILVVDDESDVVETLKNLLANCRVMGATSFEEARDLLENRYFDIAILDIMGVNGYELLDIARKRRVLSVMLTARALGPENIMNAYDKGADSYIPKEKMSDITVYLNDILEAKEKGRSSWWRWFDRFAFSYCEKKFGPGWQKKDKKFWEKLQHGL